MTSVSWQSFTLWQCVYHGSFSGGMGKYHPTFFGIELAIPPSALRASGGIAAQSLRMLDGIFPYLPQKNHGNLSLHNNYLLSTTVYPIPYLLIICWVESTKIHYFRVIRLLLLPPYQKSIRIMYWKIRRGDSK